jgi:hypothetical protein
MCVLGLSGVPVVRRLERAGGTQLQPRAAPVIHQMHETAGEGTLMIMQSTDSTMCWRRIPRFARRASREVLGVCHSHACNCTTRMLCPIIYQFKIHLQAHAGDGDRDAGEEPAVAAAVLSARHLPVHPALARPHSCHWTAFPFLGIVPLITTFRNQSSHHRYT